MPETVQELQAAIPYAIQLVVFGGDLPTMIFAGMEEIERAWRSCGDELEACLQQVAMLGRALPTVLNGAAGAGIAATIDQAEDELTKHRAFCQGMADHCRLTIADTEKNLWEMVIFGLVVTYQLVFLITSGGIATLPGVALLSQARKKFLQMLENFIAHVGLTGAKATAARIGLLGTTFGLGSASLDYGIQQAQIWNGKRDEIDGKSVAAVGLQGLGAVPGGHLGVAVVAKAAPLLGRATMPIGAAVGGIFGVLGGAAAAYPIIGEFHLTGEALLSGFAQGAAGGLGAAHPQGPPPPSALHPSSVEPTGFGDLAITNRISGTYLNQVLSDKAFHQRGDGTYDSMIPADFRPGSPEEELPAHLTRRTPPGALSDSAVQVDLAHLIVSHEGDGLLPVWRDHTEGGAFLEPRNALYRIDERGAELFDAGVHPRDPSNLDISGHVGSTGPSKGDGFVSLTASPEHAVSRHSVLGYPDLPHSEIERLVAKRRLEEDLFDGTYREVTYLHEIYTPHGIDVGATFHDTQLQTRTTGYGHNEAEILSPGGLSGDTIYRVWPREVIVDGNGRTLSATVGEPIVNPRFKYAGTAFDAAAQRANPDPTTRSTASPAVSVDPHRAGERTPPIADQAPLENGSAAQPPAHDDVVGTAEPSISRPPHRSTGAPGEIEFTSSDPQRISEMQRWGTQIHQAAVKHEATSAKLEAEVHGLADRLGVRSAGGFESIKSKLVDQGLQHSRKAAELAETGGRRARKEVTHTKQLAEDYRAAARQVDEAIEQRDSAAKAASNVRLEAIRDVARDVQAAQGASTPFTTADGQSRPAFVRADDDPATLVVASSRSGALLSHVGRASLIDVGIDRIAAIDVRVAEDGKVWVSHRPIENLAADALARTQLVQELQDRGVDVTTAKRQIGLDGPDVPVESLRDIRDAIDDVRKEFPHLDVVRAEIGATSGLAECRQVGGGGSIDSCRLILSHAWITDRVGAESNYVSHVSTGWCVPGRNAVHRTILHELGHGIAHSHDAGSNSAIRHLESAHTALEEAGVTQLTYREWIEQLPGYCFKDEVPEYARRSNADDGPEPDYGEALAEAFAHTMHSGRDWTSPHDALWRAITRQPPLDHAEIERIRLGHELGVERPESLDQPGWNTTLAHLRDQSGPDQQHRIDRLSELVADRYERYVPAGPRDYVDEPVRQGVIGEVMAELLDGRLLNDSVVYSEAERRLVVVGGTSQGFHDLARHYAFIDWPHLAADLKRTGYHLQYVDIKPTYAASGSDSYTSTRSDLAYLPPEPKP